MRRSSAKCQAHGLLLRPLPGDSIGICPPMIITDGRDRPAVRPAAGRPRRQPGRHAAWRPERPWRPQPHPWLMPLSPAGRGAGAGRGVAGLRGLVRARRPVVLARGRHRRLRRLGLLPVRELSRTERVHERSSEAGRRALRRGRPARSGSRPRCASPARTRRGRRVDDLAGVDEFHSRGREATVELADLAAGRRSTASFSTSAAASAGRRASWPPPAAYRVVGVDLTPEYVEVANELTRRCGLADRARFLTADALDLPFDDASFAAAYTQHAAMNIADKAGLYAELARVLRPGAHPGDLRHPAGPGRPGALPDALVGGRHDQLPGRPATLERHLRAAGFEVQEPSRPARGQRRLVRGASRRREAHGGPPPLSLRLLLGPLFATRSPTSSSTCARSGPSRPLCVPSGDSGRGQTGASRLQPITGGSSTSAGRRVSRAGSSSSTWLATGRPAPMASTSSAPALA